jgi:fucose 4-O-acetylase-like acetyltransferase
VDILNIMGPAIVMTAAMWGAARSPRTRAIAFAAATAAAALATPPIRSAAWPAALPDAIEGYLRPIPGLTNFVMFPWAGFAFAGALAGVLIDRRGTIADETRLQRWFAVAGVALVAIGFGGSYLPSLYERSSFWTSSPSYFAMRAGILTAAVPLAFAWERRSERLRWSPVQQLGRTSLFIYWIHVEMVYGILTRPLHRSLSLAEALAALVPFVVLLLGVSMAKDRAVSWFRQRAADRRGQTVSPL